MIRVLETTLDRAGHMPQRAFHSEEAFKGYLTNEPTILVDVTEQRMQRPGNKEDQKQDYRGKKNTRLKIVAFDQSQKANFQLSD